MTVLLWLRQPWEGVGTIGGPFIEHKKHAVLFDHDLTFQSTRKEVLNTGTSA